VAAWLMGIFVFFDDYTNTLIVGNTMRPITDRLRISREKLSFIVDATAAPVTAIAIVTSWIGFELSLLKDAFAAAGIDRNPFTAFVSSIRYSFYPLLTLFFGLAIALSRRDYGPMLKAERRARSRGLVLAEGATPLSNIDTDLGPVAEGPRRWINAALPIAVVVVGTVVGLLVTGRRSLLATGVTRYGWLDLFRESNSFDALLWSSLTGSAVAIFLAVSQRILSLREALDAWMAGVKSMMIAIVILVLAWSLGQVCSDLQTADYLVARLSGVLSAHWLPALVFLTAAAISFATGTSWGTMTILVPITVPLAVKISQLSGLAPAVADRILLESIASILAGAVFGDHCSPISDTTIMSSMASAADHVDHVRTQLPYAITVAAASMLCGYLPVGFGAPAALALLLGVGFLSAVIFFVGRPTEMPLPEEAERG
jgi:Na+/H+ antiporter NhaC